MERHWLILFILVSIRLALAEPDVSTEGSPLVPSESDLPKTTEKDDEASSSESVPASESPADKRPSIYLFKSPSSIKTAQRGKIPEVSSEYALPWSAVETTQEISTNFPGATQESTTVSVSWFGHQKQQEQQRTQQEQQRIQQEQQRMQQEQLRIQQQQQEQQRLQLLQAQQEQQRIQLKQQELQRIQLQQQREQQRIQQQEQQRIQQQEQQRIQQQQQEQQRVQIQQQEQQRVQVQQQEQQQVQVQQQEQQRVQVPQQEQERVQIQPQQQQQEETPQYQPQEQEQQHVHLRPQQEQQQVQLQQQQQVQLQQQQEQQRVQIQEQERLRVPQQNEQQVQLQQQQQQQQHQEQQIQYQPQEQEPDRQQQIQQQYQQQIQQQQRIQQQHQIQQQERLQHQQQIQKQQQTYEQQRLQQQQQQIQQQVQQQQRQSSTSGFSNIKQFKSSSVKTAQVQENVKNTESDNEVEAKGKVPFQSQPSEAERLQKADQALDQFFSDVLANLSVKMKTGMDEPLGEILDPVRLDDMQLQPLVAGEVFDVKMKKITVSGLSEYRVTQLESQLSDSRIKIGIHYPKLSANCLFGANGTMYEIFKVTGKGNATIIFNEVHARTVLYLTKENGVLQVTSADQPYVDFSSAEILFRDEDAAEDVEPVKAESVATQLGPLYFWVLTANAVDKIDYPLAEYFNKALKEFPLSDFLEGHVFRQRHMRIHVPHNPLPYAYVASELP